MIDTCEKPSILAGINTTAEQIRGQVGRARQSGIDQQLEQERPQQIAFLTALARDISAGDVYDGIKSIEWKMITCASQRGGFAGTGREALEVMKMTPRLLNAQRAVKVGNLMVNFA